MLKAEQPYPDFNPRSPRGERRIFLGRKWAPGRISIHAPREGSDKSGRNICTGRSRFQSTLPARGATRVHCALWVWRRKISIHAPREGSDAVRWALRPAAGQISIHAPREGSDLEFVAVKQVREDFNPRSPRGERPGRPLFRIRTGNFNPRSPRGERRNVWIASNRPRTFQSTLPARGATGRSAVVLLAIRISIHAPREGSDGYLSVQSMQQEKFQSTLPARGATADIILFR